MRLPENLEDRNLAAREFPPLFLAGHGHDELHQQLVEDYLDWLAPWLLQWPSLDTDLRQRFEHHARRQAFVVEQQYRLYPCILDADAITAARVESVLRRSQMPAASPDDTLSTFYIELNPCGNEQQPLSADTHRDVIFRPASYLDRSLVLHSGGSPD